MSHDVTGMFGTSNDVTEIPGISNDVKEEFYIIGPHSDDLKVKFLIKKY